MKAITLTIVIGLIGFSLCGQTKFTTHDATISFFSDAPVEDIQAESKKGRGGIDLLSGQVLFVVPINSFVFDKSLMQKHFNESYIESHLYPVARFEGRFTQPVDTATRSLQTLPFSGRLTIHGVTKMINERATVRYDTDKITAKSIFMVKTADFNIKIPRILIKNIAEEIRIEINADLIPATP
ncbi:MAG: YceI family protein [Prolixibacteraceae bacterium]|jgi:hypothetical protein|nr:YceI family protein [Prolixibacteraceae bacterium]